MSQPPQPRQRGPANPPPGPPQGYQQPPPPGPPQQPGYYPQPGWGPPPPKQSNSLKWLLIAVAVLLVIAITVGVTLFFTRGSGGGTTTPTASDIASANDMGPVAVITFEPTCQGWMSISDAIAQAQSNGWVQRDASIPASAWNSEQKGQYDAVAKSMRQTADQVVAFARQTPNRVIREVYEQYIAYSRAYANSVPTYTPSDDYLALVSVATTYVLDAVCNSIDYGSATARSASVPGVDAPSVNRHPQNPANPDRFISKPDTSCQAAIKRRDALLSDTAEWAKQDPNIPASQWSSQQKAVEEAVGPILSTFANDIESIGRGSDNGTLQDLALSSAVYFRAFVNALPTYTAADNYLVVAASRANNIIITACQAAGG
jgi:hypothetical protein